MNMEIINNKKANRFEANVDGYLALIEYGLSGKTLILKHTEVPEELGGRGLGSKIVRFALDYAQLNGLTVVPKCPFAKSYVDRHQEYAQIVSAC